MAAILDGQFFDFSMGPSDKTYQSSSSPAVIVQINDVLLTPSELLSPTALEYLAEEIEINTIDELAGIIDRHDLKACDRSNSEDAHQKPHETIMAAHALLDISPTTNGEEKKFITVDFIRDSPPSSPLPAENIDPGVADEQEDDEHGVLKQRVSHIHLDEETMRGNKKSKTCHSDHICIKVKC
eukprot:XP_796553.3 PREDICTED: uncharacterized protein LOC591914 [Strongylocentrotus purpuratus]